MLDIFKRLQYADLESAKLFNGTIIVPRVQEFRGFKCQVGRVVVGQIVV